MKGLLYKDFISLANYKLFLAGMLVLVLALGFMSGGDLTFTPITLMACVMMLSTSLFSFDDTSNWNRFALALPLSRRTLVASRYLFALLALAACFLVCLLLGIAMAFMQGTAAPIAELLAVAGVGAGVALLLNSLTFPIAYKYGAEKSRYLAIALFLAAMLGGTLLPAALWAKFFSWVAAHLTVALVCAGVLVVAAFAFSFWISCRIVGNKEY